MRIAVLVVSVAGLLAGCAEAQDRVRRVPSVKSEYHFHVVCKTFDRCLKDARDTCPGGYIKEEVGTNELAFWCRGKADW